MSALPPKADIAERQDQVSREIAKLHQEILDKVSASPPSPPIAAAPAAPICDAYFNELPGHRADQKGAPKAASSNR
jgi:hypothetical protein